MSLPEIVSREQWLTARIDLLAQEKELTRRRDALSARRRELPMVEITDADYRFEGPDGEVSLLELFDGRRQLIVRHFMFDPEWDEGCPSCTAGTGEIADALLRHLNARETSFAVVARAPIDKLERYKADHGWTFTWVSSLNSSFNYDFHVTLDERVAPVSYNYRSAAEFEAAGAPLLPGDMQTTEMPGQSCFLRDGDRVFHTYSSFARGAEATGGSYYFLDETALGRQEEWEEPRGRADLNASRPDFA